MSRFNYDIGEAFNQYETVFTKSLGSETAPCESVYTENLGSETTPSDTVYTENLGSETAPSDNVFAKSLGNIYTPVDTLYINKIQFDTGSITDPTPGAVVPVTNFKPELYAPGVDITTSLNTSSYIAHGKLVSYQFELTFKKNGTSIDNSVYAPQEQKVRISIPHTPIHVSAVSIGFVTRIEYTGMLTAMTDAGHNRIQLYNLNSNDDNSEAIANDIMLNDEGTISGSCQYFIA